ncbi:MAG: MoaD/ThiS family protein [Planctomycetota bacterium]|jgi:molybdopterin converting factor small subunit
MPITVRLFAGVKEKAGRAELEVAGATIAEVRDALAEAVPAVAGLLPACRFAMNDEFVTVDSEVTEGALVDVIPPVSGG